MLEGSAGSAKRVETRPGVVIRFAGDSGDGMQLTGMQFTNETRSGRQRPQHPARLSGRDPRPGRHAGRRQRVPAPLLEPRRLHARRRARRAGGDEPGGAEGQHRRPRGERHPHRRQGAFNEQNLKKAEYAANPLDRRLARPLPGLSRRHHQAHHQRAQGHRPADPHDDALAQLLRPRPHVVAVRTARSSRPSEWIDQRFKKNPSVGEANAAVLKAGLELRRDRRDVPHRVQGSPGRRSRRDATATSPATRRPRSGFVAAAQPRRPAALPRQLPDHAGQRHPARALDAEELRRRTPSRPRTRSPASARRSAPRSAAPSRVTTTSGPGVASRPKRSAWRCRTELPLVIADIQRGGPSTGLPTKTEQADLLLALYGRNSESPIPILAPATPADCFAMAFEAVRIAITYMTPVILLSDGYLANGAEPWLIPRAEDAAGDPGHLPHRSEGLLPVRARPRDAGAPVGDPGHARARAPHRRPREGLPHRQHQLRAGEPRADGARPRRKIAGIAREIPPTEIHGPPYGDLLVIGWGSTYGAIRQAATERCAARARRCRTCTCAT